MPPIFEKSQSPLVRSNDGRLTILTDPIERGKAIEYVAYYAPKPHYDEEVFRTHNRVMADAYVAGYDFRCSIGSVDDPEWEAS